jgi:L-alanine-DL-glutamate epimerase-like enolase superfamily enzyme
MKIVDIRTIPLSYRCEPPYGSAGGMQAQRGGLLVEIETDERVTGIGEAGSAVAPLRASSKRYCGRCWLARTRC